MRIDYEHFVELQLGCWVTFLINWYRLGRTMQLLLSTYAQLRRQLQAEHVQIKLDEI